MFLASTDLELGVDNKNLQAVGIRFEGLVIPKGSTIRRAYIQFTTDEAFTGTSSLFIQAEAIPAPTRYEWDPDSGRILVFEGPNDLQGSYLQDGPIKTDAGTVARPFPLRLIVHNDGTTSRLLQRVYLGVDKGTNTVLATQEKTVLEAEPQLARRISSVHLPFSKGNTPWAFNGALQQGVSIKTTVPLAFNDQAANPFLHTYHPDHDNLDAQFVPINTPGTESYGITREITLRFTAPTTQDFQSLIQGNQVLSGGYGETVGFQTRNNHTQEYNVLGTFRLNKISDIETLTTTP